MKSSAGALGVASAKRLTSRQVALKSALRTPLRAPPDENARAAETPPPEPAKRSPAADRASRERFAALKKQAAAVEARAAEREAAREVAERRARDARAAAARKEVSLRLARAKPRGLQIFNPTST